MMRDRLFTERSEKNMDGMKAKDVFFIIIKLAVIVFLFVCLNRLFMPKYVKENMDGRITREYYPASKYTDVVFVGSSTVFSGVSPKVLWDSGISSFDRANASQTMWISYFMIEDAIKTRKPELVCLDMTFVKHDDYFIEEPSTRKAIDGMRWGKTKYKCIVASKGEDEKMADYVIPLFRYHERWKDLTWDDFRYMFYNKPVTECGFIEDNEIESANASEFAYFGDFSHIYARNEMYLRAAIEECKNNGVQIMLFKTPAFAGNWSDELDDAIEAVAQEYGIAYYNFDRSIDDIGLDPETDTPDGGAHLNSAGAEKFSRYIGGIIRNSYDVSDRSTDPDYVAYWDKI